MSRGTARLLAAALWTFGVTSLVMLAMNLDAMGIFLLVVGVGTVSVGTWINTATGAAPPMPPQERPPPSSPDSAS